MVNDFPAGDYAGPRDGMNNYDTTAQDTWDISGSPTQPPSQSGVDYDHDSAVNSTNAQIMPSGTAESQFEATQHQSQQLPRSSAAAILPPPLPVVPRKFLRVQTPSIIPP